jgi:hypothetical protein
MKETLPKADGRGSQATTVVKRRGDVPLAIALPPQTLLPIRFLYLLILLLLLLLLMYSSLANPTVIDRPTHPAAGGADREGKARV